MTQLVGETDQVLIEEALTELVMSCPELVQLEARLAQFNIFRVLKADQHEIRHSNMLAWILEPDGSHGLDLLFLRRWLMDVMHRARQTEVSNAPTISPITIDAIAIRSVEVHRELYNIDVLLILDVDDDKQWVVCIENKVNARQGVQQLRKYREKVESVYADADQLFFLFLTKNDEQPADEQYLAVSYESVADVLDRCMTERRDSIGHEPAILIDHYRQLLREDFMNDNESMQLAREIYKRHSKAIDFILENKRDPVFEITNRIEDVLKHEGGQLGVKLSKTGKGRIRFIPDEWDTDQNALGSAWGQGSHYLVFELDLYMKRVEVSMMAAGAPEGWASQLWEKCASEPLQRSQKTQPTKWLKAFRAKSKFSVSDETDAEAMADDIVTWLKQEMASEKFLAAKQILTEHLKTLKAA